MAGVGDRSDINAAQALIDKMLQQIAVTQTMLTTAELNVDRDLDYASRAIDLALAKFSDKDGGGGEEEAGGGGGGLAIAMLVKDPSLLALSTFVRYHSHLGFTRFEFFVDDLHDGQDAPACNDRAVAALRELGLELAAGGPAVVFAHRCDTAWWAAAESGSEVWARWGHHLLSEVTARQVVAIERAVQLSLAAGCEWLLHIDVDEALCCGGLVGPSAGGPAAGKDAAASFFHGLPAGLDQVRLPFLDLPLPFLDLPLPFHCLSLTSHCRSLHVHRLFVACRSPS